ncbi:MAG: NAD(P)H-binding protein [Crocinitomix sp.]|nr:NAD(P)H-binding protein [Crocinitomix sp.]
MKTLVLGASGATGKHLVEQLLAMNQQVKVIVRSTAKIPESWKSNNNLSIIQATVLDIPMDEMAKHIKDCGAVASCLGHNISFKGIYGKPRKLVRDSVKLLCKAITQNKTQQPIKLVLMNTAGNRNGDLTEPISFGEKIVIGLIRALLPPQADNEQAAEYLRVQIGQKDPHVSWAAVRPDDLIDADDVSDYTAHPSPTCSTIFNAGKTSRINVGHFMATLITDDAVWNKWKGQMPVLYNQSSETKEK